MKDPRKAWLNQQEMLSPVRRLRREVEFLKHGIKEAKLQRKHNPYKEDHAAQDEEILQWEFDLNQAETDLFESTK